MAKFELNTLCAETQQVNLFSSVLSGDRSVGNLENVIKLENLENCILSLSGDPYPLFSILILSIFFI